MYAKGQIQNVVKKICFISYYYMQNTYMDKPIKNKKVNFSMFAVRSLAISASTLALLDFLKGEYKFGVLLAVGWLTILIGEKRLFNENKTNEER